MVENSPPLMSTVNDRNGQNQRQQLALWDLKAQNFNETPRELIKRRPSTYLPKSSGQVERFPLQQSKEQRRLKYFLETFLRNYRKTPNPMVCRLRTNMYRENCAQSVTYFAQRRLTERQEKWIRQYLYLD